MTLETVQAAVLACNRFLDCYVDIQRKRLHRFPDGTMVLSTGNPETAALRRASMNLTRALARMRKPS